MLEPVKPNTPKWKPCESRKEILFHVGADTEACNSPKFVRYWSTEIKECTHEDEEHHRHKYEEEPWNCCSGGHDESLGRDCDRRQLCVPFSHHTTQTHCRGLRGRDEDKVEGMAWKGWWEERFIWEAAVRAGIAPEANCHAA